MPKKKTTTPGKKPVSVHESYKKKTSPPQSRSLPPWVWAAVLVVILTAAGVYWITRQSSTKPAGLPDEISIQQAHQMYNEGAFVLDVRTNEEWVEYHAPGTTLIPLAELPNRLSELPRDREIVVVCRSGNRSQEGRDILKQAGFEQVTSMSGGLNAWRTAGFPITSGE